MFKAYKTTMHGPLLNTLLDGRHSCVLARVLSNNTTLPNIEQLQGLHGPLYKQNCGVCINGNGAIMNK